MIQWIPAKIVNLKIWDDRLFTLILNAKIKPFIPGQFTRLLLIKNDHTRIQRAYSFVNSPKNKNLEFYILLIPNGNLTPKLLQKNDKNLFISQESFGFFTISEIPSCKNLWMIATGTAIGPYCSILQDINNNINKFEKIFLIYAVKYEKNLNYLNILEKIAKSYKNKIIIKIILSQEKKKKYLFGRIPELIKNGTLERSVQETINTSTSHVMLCGNPNMVKETLYILKKYKNMNKHLRRKPGNITSEKYW